MGGKVEEGIRIDSLDNIDVNYGVKERCAGRK